MLGKERLDMVAVYLPYARNAYAITAAANAGVHVLSEKPVAVNHGDLEMVEKAVNRSGIRLSTMFALRYSSPIYTIKRQMVKGVIGKPHLARAQKSYKWGDARPWFYKYPGIFGSTILWVGIHAVDYLRWCVGLEVIRVSGFHSNLSHTAYPGAQDNAVISMELEGGATAAITMDYLRPGTAPTHGDDRLRIAGSHGVIETQLEEGTVELINHKEGSRSVELEQPPRTLFQDFVSELRGQSVHLIDKDDAIQVSRICIAATLAAEEGKTVQIESG
jgi:predicted dehydrogenase